MQRWLLPKIVLLTHSDTIGEPFQYHVECLSLQPMFPLKPFDRFAYRIGNRVNCIFIYLLIEFSHKLISNILARGHKVVKHNSEGKNVRRTFHSKRKRQGKKNYSETARSPNKQRRRKKHVWLSGCLHIEGPRLQRKHKEENQAENKCNTRERRHDICKPNVRRMQVRAARG